MALTFNDTLAELLQARVMERMTEEAEQLASGSAQDSITRYQNRVGFVHGLKESLEILADVQKTLQER